MFKAKLIENNKYYNLKNKQLLWVVIPVILLGVIGSLVENSVWLTIVIIILYLLVFLFMIRNKLQINSTIGDRILEIDSKKIRIKSQKTILEETIDLDKVEKLILKKEYVIPQERLKDVREGLEGKTTENYLIVQKDNQDRRFDFAIDTHYMITQLEKLIQSWESKGYQIERIS